MTIFLPFVTSKATIMINYVQATLIANNATAPLMYTKDTIVGGIQGLMSTMNTVYTTLTSYINTDTILNNKSAVFNALGRITNTCLESLAKDGWIPQTISPYHNIQMPKNPQQEHSSRTDIDAEIGFYYMVAAALIMLCITTAYTAPRIIRRIKNTGNKADANSKEFTGATRSKESFQQDLNNKTLNSKTAQPLNKGITNPTHNKLPNHNIYHYPCSKSSLVFDYDKDCFLYDKEDLCQDNDTHIEECCNKIRTQHVTYINSPNTSMCNTSTTEPNSHQSANKELDAECRNI